MIITCEQCHSSFKLDESRLRPTGSRVRCSDCRHVFTAFPPQVDDLSPPAAAVLATGEARSAPASEPLSESSLDAMLDGFLAGEGGTIQRRAAVADAPPGADASEIQDDFDFDMVSIADEVTEAPPITAEQALPIDVPLSEEDDDLTFELDLELVAPGSEDQTLEQTPDFDLGLDELDEKELAAEGEIKTDKGDEGAGLDEEFDLDEVERELDLDILPESVEPVAAPAAASVDADLSQAQLSAAPDFDLIFDKEPATEAGESDDIGLEDIEAVLGTQLKELDTTGEDAPSPLVEAQSLFDESADLDESDRKTAASASDDIDLEDLEAVLGDRLKELDDVGAASQRPLDQAAPAHKEGADIDDIDQILKEVAGLDADFSLETEASSTQAVSVATTEDEEQLLELDFDYDQDDTQHALAGAGPEGGVGEFEDLERMLELEMGEAAAPSASGQFDEDIDADLEKLLSEIDAPASGKPETVVAKVGDLAAEIESLIDIEPGLDSQAAIADEDLEFDLKDTVEIVPAEAGDKKAQWSEPSVGLASIEDDVSEGTYRGEEPEDGLGELELSLSPERSEPRDSSIKEYELEGPVSASPAEGVGLGGDMQLEFEIEEEGSAPKEARPVATSLTEGAAADLNGTYTMSALPAALEAQAAAEAAAAKKAPLRFRRRRRWPKVLLVLLLILLLGGIAAIVALEWLGMPLPGVGPALRQIPYIQQLLPPEEVDAGNLKIRTQAISSHFVESKSAGRLFVISGQTVNDYPQARSYILLTAKLYLKNKVISQTESAYAGNLLSDAELAASDLAAIKKSMKNRSGDKNSNVNVSPGKALPFMVVFSQIPEGLEEYTLEVTSSSAGETAP